VYILTLDSKTVGAKVLNIVAQSMIPACLIGILWEAFIKKAFVQYIRKEFKLNDQLDEYGIKGIFYNRSKISLSENIIKARRRIWILLTSFSYLTETSGLLEALTCKAKGVKLRILGLAPNTESARLRSNFNPKQYKNLNQIIPEYKDKLINGLIERKEEIQNVQIRLYDKIPTCAFFIIDNQIFLCPLLCHKRGRNTVHLLISSPTKSEEASKMFTEYEEHFEKLFQEASIEFPPGTNNN
jgi:hypothetical protein